jgi:hypothetical protein
MEKQSTGYLGFPFVSPQLAIKYNAIILDVPDVPYCQVFHLECRQLLVNTAATPNNIIYLLKRPDIQEHPIRHSSAPDNIRPFRPMTDMKGME